MSNTNIMTNETTVSNGNLVDEMRQLETRRAKLEMEIGNAQAELDQAKANQKKTGEYMDPIEFAELKTKVRDGTNELHALNRDIKALRSKINRSNPKASYFQQAAKQILDEDTYNKVEDLANNWIRSA